MNLIEWLVSKEHERRKGHRPVWYDLGAGERQCLNCLKGGHRSRLRPRLRPLLNPVPTW